MKTILKTLWLALAAAAILTACNDPAPTPVVPVPPPAPEPPPPVVVVAESAISFGSDTLKFESIVFDGTQTKTHLYVFASPNPGITTYDEIMRLENNVHVNRPLMMIIGYDDMNKTIDVMTEISAIFGMANYTGVGKEIANFANGMYPTINAGAFTSTYDKATGKLSLSFDVTATESGNQLKANITGTFIQAPDTETSIMKYNDEEFAVKSKFYEVTDVGTALYVSADKISASKIPESAHYAKVLVSKDNLGKVIDIEQATEGFEITYQYKKEQTEMIVIAPNKLNGAKGTLKITDLGQNKYELEYLIIINEETTISATANGKFEVAGDGNQYTIFGKPADVVTPIKSVVVEKKAGGGAFIDIYLSGVADIATVADMTSKGNPIVIRTKEAYMTGAQISFSSKTDVSITYDGVKYNAASKADGTFKCKLVDNTLTLTQLLVIKAPFVMEARYVGSKITIIE